MPAAVLRATNANLENFIVDLKDLFVVLRKKDDEVSKTNYTKWRAAAHSRKHDVKNKPPALYY